MSPYLLKKSATRKSDQQLIDPIYNQVKLDDIPAWACQKKQMIYNSTKMHVRARADGPPYQGSCIGPLDQSHPLDLALKAPRARRTPAIRLFINDLERFVNKMTLIEISKCNTQVGHLNLTPSINFFTNKKNQ